MLISDIKTRVLIEFSDANAFEVARLLETYTGEEANRVLRCILYLAQGDVTKIAHFVDAACADYRDVIYWAENDQSDRKVRDFSKPY